MELADLILEVRSGKKGLAKESQTSASGSTASTPPHAAGTPEASSTPERQESPRASEGGAEKPPGSPIGALQAEPRVQRPECGACGIDAQDLCGNWTDSFGNTVCVYSVDAYSANLVATLSKPPRRDFNLPLHRMPDGRGWRCGGAMLEFSSAQELHWRFPNGRVSVWQRMEAVPAAPAGYGGYVVCTPQGVQGMIGPGMVYQAQHGGGMAMIDTGAANQVPNGNGALVPQFFYTWLPARRH